MLERIEGNDPGTKRWEALIKYRQSKNEEPSAGGDKVPKNKSAEGNKRPETTVSQQGETRDANRTEKTRKKIGTDGCETCKNRKYVDQSGDSSVSFQTPTHVAPESAASAVMAHEGEHVAHEQAKAEETGAKVVSQTVQIFTSICPECGKVYVSGGLTTTTTATETNSGDSGKSGDSEDSQSRFDVRV